MNSDESRIARFSGWFEQRPTSLTFWELFVTDRRVIWCFVGESFKSLLLRSDTAARAREQLDGIPPGQALSRHEQNHAVPLDSLRTIRLREGSWLRRATLTLEWDENESDTTIVTLYGTQSSDSQVDVGRDLRDEPALAEIDITAETAGLL